MEAMHPDVELHYAEYEDTRGFGPCGAVAAMMRRRGMGQIAITTVQTDDGYTFCHYVIIDGAGTVIDWTNPFPAGRYLAEEFAWGFGGSAGDNPFVILPDDEMPDVVDEADINFWEERIAA